jgi:hypothetical protein
LTAIALGALLALVPTLLSLGLHSGPESVAAATLEPTTVYKSEHRGQGNEIHFHPDVGFESSFCLACFTSLRNQSLLAGEPIVTTSDLGAFARTSAELVPDSRPAHAFSSRAPPRT